MEISERERAERRLDRSQKSKNEVGAASFRLGKDHLAKLRKMSESSDLSQAEVVRTLIDKEWVAIQDARAKRKPQ